MARAKARTARGRPPPRGAAVYRALADDTRRAILVLLAEGPATAGAIAEAFPDISRAAVSKHLAVLREASLVSDRASGRERIYSLEPGPLAELTSYVAQLDAVWSRSLANLGAHLDKM